MASKAGGGKTIDDFLPTWQFREVHRIAVLAPVESAMRAIREVTASEIRLFRFLTWIRRLGWPGPESILNPPPNVPILDVALRTGFLLLASARNEVVLGTAVIAPRGAPKPKTPDEFLAINAPGWARAVMNFRIDNPALAMCVVTTETRVHATDLRTERNFGFYWWTIRPGSGLIRRLWLRAIRRRAEKTGS